MDGFEEVKLFDLPEHILKSKYYNGLIGLSGISEESEWSFLRGSNEAGNLSIVSDASDESLLFPSDAYKPTLSIETTSDIGQIIRSELFFGYDQETKIQILENIYKFSLKTEDPITFPPITTSPFSRGVHELLTTPEHSMVKDAMKTNQPELLLFALKMDFPHHKGPLFGFSDDYLYLGASNNCVECVAIGLANGFEISTSAFETAVSKDCLEIVKMFVEAGFRKSSRMCKLSKNMEMLEYLFSNGFPWDAETTNVLAKNGNPQCLEWIIAKGCPVSSDICFNAAIGGNIRCMEIAFAHSLDRSELIACEAIYNDRLEAFEYAAEHGVKITQASMNKFLGRNNSTNDTCQINITRARVSKYIAK